MSTADSSYYQLHTALREQTDIDSVFQRSLDELSGKVDFSWVKSCVSLGTGYGAQELLFVKRFLPNLQTFIAVEPDHESLNALRAGFQNGELPGVETTVIESSVNRWHGVDKPVDIVLLFNVLCHVKQADRQALFQQLITQYLTPNGIVIIITDCKQTTTPGFWQLMQRLGQPIPGYYEENETEMLTAGFSLVHTYDMKGTLDFSGNSEHLVKYAQIVSGNKASEQEVRTAIAEVYGQREHFTWHKKFALFKKASLILHV